MARRSDIMQTANGSARTSGRFLQRVRSTVRGVAGETLIEVLIALLIIVLAVSMLAIAVGTSARVNASIDPEETVFNFYGQKPASAEIAIKHVSSVADDTELDVEGYETAEEKGGYVYYVCS